MKARRMREVANTLDELSDATGLEWEYSGVHHSFSATLILTDTKERVGLCVRKVNEGLWVAGLLVRTREKATESVDLARGDTALQAVIRCGEPLWWIGNRFEMIVENNHV